MKTTKNRRGGANTPQSSAGGFTLIELLIVISIIGILAGSAGPAYQKVKQTGEQTRAVSNIRNILMGCRNFATDHDGQYPTYDTKSDNREPFTEAHIAFGALVPDYIDTEGVFWIPTRHPDKRPPNEDGELEKSECLFGYAVGQSDSSFSNSPLVFDGLMESAGAMGEYHPWLDSKKAIIGFCDSHIDKFPLTSGRPGATVKSKDGRIDNIFTKREQGEDGKSAGGYLDTKEDNVLLAE